MRWWKYTKREMNELITSYVAKAPVTVKNLVDYFGMTRTTMFGHLNRLVHAKRLRMITNTKRDQIIYYIYDSNRKERMRVNLRKEL